MQLTRPWPRSRGLAVCVGGLGAAFVALALWVSGLAVRWLDAVSLALFALGFIASTLAFVFGADVRTRRLAVVGLGVCAAGALGISVLYFVG